jgi:hypothetical protein
MFFLLGEIQDKFDHYSETINWETFGMWQGYDNVFTDSEEAHHSIRREKILSNLRRLKAMKISYR